MKNGRSVMDTSNEYVKRDDVLNAISNFADGFENSLFFKIFIRASLESLNDTLLFLPITRIAKSQHWDFVINEERVGYWEGKIISLYYNGYKCSNCGHGGGEAIPKSYGEMTEEDEADSENINVLEDIEEDDCI